MPPPFTPPPIIPSGINPTGAPVHDPVALAKARVALLEKIEWLERLRANEDLVKFFKVAQRRTDETELNASDIDGHTAEQRDAWAQAHFELRTMMLWPERELAKALAALKELDGKASNQ